jgi:hypothetical protein
VFYGGTPAQKARARISIEREQLVSEIAKKLFTMLENRDAIKEDPVTKEKTAIKLTDKDRAKIAKLYAEAYVAAVEDFLEKHPGATPHNCARASDIIRAPTEKDRARQPICEDWGFRITDRMDNVGVRTILLESGQEIRLDWVITVEPAQHNGILWTSIGQHNFCVLFPTGYEIEDPRTDQVLRVLDAWWDLMPRIFTTKEYTSPLISDVDRVGIENIKVGHAEPWIKRWAKWDWEAFRRSSRPGPLIPSFR